jgi:hypothetical protein
MSLSTLFVARGRSVSLNGQLHPPGATVTLPSDEADYLESLGFLVPLPPNLAPAVMEQNPAGIGSQGANVQGPRYQ